MLLRKIAEWVYERRRLRDGTVHYLLGKRISHYPWGDWDIALFGRVLLWQDGELLYGPDDDDAPDDAYRTLWPRRKELYRR